MDDNTARREKFEELAESLTSVDAADVLSALVDAREAGIVSKGLDEQINRLRDELVSPSEVVEWVKDVAAGAEELSFAVDSSLSDPSSIDLDEVVDEVDEEPNDEVDFAMVGDSDPAGLAPLSTAISGVSATKDEVSNGDNDVDSIVTEAAATEAAATEAAADKEADQSANEPDVDDSASPGPDVSEQSKSERSEDPDGGPPLEEHGSAEIGEESDGSTTDGSDDNSEDDLAHSVGLFDDIGDLMAEAGQKAIEDSPAFKLPKLQKPTKKLSGAARKKLSKKFSLPSPTKEVTAVDKSALGGNETPIAGLEAIQGLVANSRKTGKTPQLPRNESRSDSGDEFPIDFGIDDVVEQATEKTSGAQSSADGYPEDIEDLADSASEALELDSVAEGVPAIEEDQNPEPAPVEEPSLDFGDLDQESASVEGTSSPGFGVGPGMGSLFDDDELAEIQAAGEKDPKAKRKSSGGARYDSGNSGARYAGKAPPPPTHRLGSGSGPKAAPMTGFQVESEGEEDDFDLDFGFEAPGGGFGSGANTGEESTSKEEDGDFEFDLGLDKPEDRTTSGSTPGIPIGQESSVQEDDDDFDFDLGFDNPANKIKPPGTGPKGYSEGDFDLGGDDVGGVGDQLSGGVTKGPPGISPPAGASTEEREDYDSLRKQAVRSDVLGGNQRREHRPTPMRQQEAVQRPNRPSQPTPIARDRIGGAAEIGEDEFESLAASFADSDADSKYRGEPMLSDDSSEELIELQPHDDAGNPFAHEAPTGVHHAAVESSFVLEEVSAAEDTSGTNLAAILLEARRLYENGEFTSAMDIVQKVLSREQSQEALDLKQAIEGELERHELEKIGSLSKTPSLQISMAEIPTLDIDHRAGFLLSQIDGFMTFEDVLELSAMSRFETLTVLSDLIEKGVIAAE